MRASPIRCFAASFRSSRLPHQGDPVAELLSSISHRPKKDKQRAVDSAQTVVHEDPAVHLASVLSDPMNPFDLSSFHPIFDIHPELYSDPVPGVRTVLINETPPFGRPSPATLAYFKTNSVQEGEEEPLSQLAADASIRFGLKDLRALHRYNLVTHYVSNMTNKGKQRSYYCLLVVGNGEGLLGYGEGRALLGGAAADKAFVQAVKNMDYVQRKDDRTTWSNLMTTKWGATTVEIRSRPPGFGLRVSPIIHQIAKAAGILDLSAKIRGSRNGMNTVKATVNLLHGGSSPIGLGHISGKEKLAKRYKGVGMRTSSEIGLDLGRRAVELR